MTINSYTGGKELFRGNFNTSKIADFLKQADSNKDGAISKKEMNTFLKAVAPITNSNQQTKVLVNQITSMQSQIINKTIDKNMLKQIDTNAEHAFNDNKPVKTKETTNLSSSKSGKEVIETQQKPSFWERLFGRNTKTTNQNTNNTQISQNKETSNQNKKGFFGWLSNVFNGKVSTTKSSNLNVTDEDILNVAKGRNGGIIIRKGSYEETRSIIDKLSTHATGKQKDLLNILKAYSGIEYNTTLDDLPPNLQYINTTYKQGVLRMDCQQLVYEVAKMSTNKGIYSKFLDFFSQKKYEDFGNAINDYSKSGNADMVYPPSSNPKEWENGVYVTVLRGVHVVFFLKFEGEVYRYDASPSRNKDSVVLEKPTARDRISEKVVRLASNDNKTSSTRTA